MPTGPKGQKRPADVIGAAVMVAKIATGEIEEKAAEHRPAAELGSKGGKARAASLSSSEKAAIASRAAAARWGKKAP